MPESQFFGKHRGVVVDNADPENLGRIEVMLDVLGSRTAWCMPCVPYAGESFGWFFIPEVGAHVWVEFERGDPSYPIWTGCFWADKAPPGATPARKTLKTPTTTLVIDDTDPKNGVFELDTTANGQTLSIKIDKAGITLTAETAKITIATNEAAIELSGGTITLSGSAINIG